MGDHTFKPPVRDYHTKHVREDHAPNQALHDALHAAIGTDNDGPTVNLMGSHASGEKPHEPTYEVWVESTNDGLGHPQIPDVVRRMVDRNDAKITGVVECSDDHLIVSLRPVETRVEPVEVETRHIPDRFVDVNDVEHRAAHTLRMVVDEYGVESDRGGEAARSLATVLQTIAPERYAEFVEDPDAAPRAAYRQLWRKAGVDPDTNEVTNIRPTNHGYEWEGAEDERTREYVDDISCPECGADLRLFGTESWYKCGECGKSGDTDEIDGFPDPADWSQDDVDDFAEAFDGEPDDDTLDAIRHGLYAASHLPDDPYAGFPYHEVGREPPTGRPPVDPIREWVRDNWSKFSTTVDVGADEIAERIADAIAEHEAGFDGASQAEVDDAFDPDEAVDRWEADDGGATDE